MPFLSPIVWAIHIADGVLDWPWLLAGFVVTGVLALLASWRVREDEVPRIALLTAAFFVASSIHVKLGPTSVHLLLNGLVGVVLGWRAPLAILIGVILQALLIPHGGLTTIGINAAVEIIPALVAAMLFPPLVAWSGRDRQWPRAFLIFLSILLVGGFVIFGVGVLSTNPWRDLVQFSREAGLVVSVSDENYSAARRVLFHPLTVLSLVLLGLMIALLERRVPNAPEFPAGTIVGAMAVLGTTFLTGLVLVADGADRWSTYARAVFLAHLPLAVVEGFILGMIVGFVARVKPEMLPHLLDAEHTAQIPLAEASRRMSTLIVLGILGALFFAQPALAHRLEMNAKVDKGKKQVRIECWYETGDPPSEAKAKVIREDGSTLVEGPVDARGFFVFTFDDLEPLKVVISAPGGHHAVLRLSKADLGAEPESTTLSQPEERSRGRDILLGLTFLLALSAFVLSWRNTLRLQRLTDGDQSAMGNTSSSATSH
jgi:cobalt/nickel transport system permease protein